MTGTQEGRPVVNVPLFLNGEGMRGGRVHPHIARYPFLGEARTAPRYRFYVYEDRFPALWPVPELELGVIELAGGSASLAVVLRPDVHARGTGLVDISDYGGWRAYLERR
jgi:hypothetical protein